jgi:uncharacterized protein (DUF58 family)
MSTSPQAADAPLLDPEFIVRIERLELVAHKIFHGKMRGERRSKRRGESVEFADYRNYVVGDDLRFLDWNIYARLEKLFLKLFLEEEDLHLNVLVDLSASMDWGKPKKDRYARQVAAALAYIGLANNDRVSVFTFADGLSGELSGLRGKRQLPKLLAFLSEAPASGISNFTAACRHFALRHGQPGVLLVLSDFFDKGGYESGLRTLLGRRYDLYCIQLLSPEEIEPTLTGELKLTDVEDGDIAEVTVSRALLHRYKANLQAYCTQLRDYCTRRGIAYAFTSTAVPFDQIVLGYLRQRGLLR